MLMVRGSAATITRNLPKNAWRRLSAGDGTKGARLHDWAYLELADLNVGEYNSTLTGKWTRGLAQTAFAAGPSSSRRPQG
jgi:SRSO17 transposase